MSRNEAMDRLNAARERPDAGAARGVLKPTRVSVDLEHEDYDTLVRFGVTVAYERGLPPIHRVKIFRALLRELAEDAELRARVAARLEDNGTDDNEGYRR